MGLMYNAEILYSLTSFLRGKGLGLQPLLAYSLNPEKAEEHN